MTKAFIAAATMIPFGKYPESSAAALGRRAVQDILAQSSLGASDIQAAYFGRSFSGPLDGQVSVPGQSALNGLGLHDIPVMNFDNACAACPTALSVAVDAIRAGKYEIVLVVGMDKLFARSRVASMKALFGAVDVDAMAWLGAAIERDGGGSIFMESYYADAARGYLSDGGATLNDYAAVAVKNRKHAAQNPFAQYRAAISEDDVLASPLVADPLRKLMCSPLTDGAAALLVCSERARHRFPQPHVVVRAIALRSGLPQRGTADPALTRAAREAYERAGLGPKDLDVVEVHDASAAAELIAVEQLGLASAGDGVKLLREGDSALGGRYPVNVSGGLLSRGHPGAATGAAQLVELVWQLQGRTGARQVEDARIALSHSSGGLIGDEPAMTAVTILERA